MRRAAIVLLLCAACVGQTTVPSTQLSQRKELLNNRHMTASLIEIAPGEATPMHRHDHDIISVYITGGRISNLFPGQKPMSDQPKTEKLAPGEVRFHGSGYTHAAKNEGASLFRAVVIDFADPRGKLELLQTSSHYCNPGSTTACVDEKNLFCTAKVCVEDVTIAPGAVTTKHSHTTDHMLVAVSDYELTDQVEGKGTVVRARKSAEIEYIPAGITHQLTNTGHAPARFIVLLWR